MSVNTVVNLPHLSISYPSFPLYSQDGMVSICAHADLLMITKYMYKKYNFNNYKLKEIIENKNIYILIDAINETPNRAVWKNGLAKILSEIEKRVHIKIILSVRAGYENLVFEENMNKKLQDGRILSVIHVGFQDKSIEATREFLNFHGIPFSTSDFLNYEMTNPLYLTLFCMVLNLVYHFEERLFLYF